MIKLRYDRLNIMWQVEKGISYLNRKQSSKNSENIQENVSTYSKQATLLLPYILLLLSLLRLLQILLL